MTTAEDARQAEPVKEAEAWVWLARIRRTQGRKGEVFAELLTDFPEKFAVRRRLWLISEAAAPHPAASRLFIGHSPREVELLAHWTHKGGIVLHFAGVDSITGAEAMTGLIVAIPRAERAVLGEDEVYIGDLIGCELVDVAAAEPVVVGEIEEVDRTAGPVALLVVRGRAPRVTAGEVLIPFAKGYLRGIDIAGRRVEMALPEGLVELNAPGQEPGQEPEQEPGQEPDQV